MQNKRSINAQLDSVKPLEEPAKPIDNLLSAHQNLKLIAKSQHAKDFNEKSS